MTTNQFDVYANPISKARAVYPYVVVMQSELAAASSERIVAPLVPRQSLPSTVGRLAPLVRVGESEYVVIVPRLTGIAGKDLREFTDSLTAYRGELLAAVDYLFFGV